jgi:hypothetical protein
MSRLVPASLSKRLLQKLRSAALLLVAFASFAMASSAHATIVIPASERAVLLALYNNADGPDWTSNTGWNGPSGTECSWHGVVCAQTPGAFCQINFKGGGALCPGNVVEIHLSNNKMFGSIENVALNSLTDLQVFDVSENLLVNSLPDFSKTPMSVFDASDNRLAGSIPSLSGLVALQYFDVSFNQLTGSIPSLTGLVSLSYFHVGDNQLTGSIPSLAGLTNLQYFAVYQNWQLTGPIPDLSGLPNLRTFAAFQNQLSGPIPPLESATKLVVFWVSANQLTGAIPPIATLANLYAFDVHDNHLTGTIPCLSTAYPCLSTLTQLTTFSVQANELTGSIPSLAGLVSLQSFDVGYNQLTGTVPAAPSTLTAGSSNLCPNGLATSSDGAANLAWDFATGVTPWNSACGGAITQTITFTSQPPSFPVANLAMGAHGTYDPTAITSTGLLNTVILSIDAASVNVCRTGGNGIVTYFAPGNCIINANAYGSSVYAPAAQAQQSFRVYPLLQR